VRRLVIAGWTGRDQAAVERHIAELEAIGVPRPASVPCYYRVAVSLVTTDPSIQTVGEAATGEVEGVLLSAAGDLLVGVGSDHTDRHMERQSVAFSKQVCPKPIGAEWWRFEDVAPHWDELALRSYAWIHGVRRLYQEGTLRQMRRPEDLIRGCTGGASVLPEGTVMFLGTLPVHGGIAAASRFEIELEDPVLGRTLRHAYDIECLPVVG
jgi:hypothetical protein